MSNNVSANILPKGYRGYCTHREFDGKRIPVPVQNLILRDYSTRRNLLFKLSVNELIFPNCFLHLESLLEELPNLEGIIMCSLFMLPKDNTARLAIYEKIITNGATLHLIFEEAIVCNYSDIERVEEIYQVSETLMNSPKFIPKELLPDLQGLDFFVCEGN